MSRSNDRTIWWKTSLTQPATEPPPRLVVVTDIDTSLPESGAQTVFHERAARESTRLHDARCALKSNLREEGARQKVADTTLAVPESSAAAAASGVRRI